MSRSRRIGASLKGRRYSLPALPRPGPGAPFAFSMSRSSAPALRSARSRARASRDRSGRAPRPILDCSALASPPTAVGARTALPAADMPARRFPASAGAGRHARGPAIERRGVGGFHVAPDRPVNRDWVHSGIFSGRLISRKIKRGGGFPMARGGDRPGAGRPGGVSAPAAPAPEKSNGKSKPVPKSKTRSKHARRDEQSGSRRRPARPRGNYVTL
jgi:hypothetical protein